MILPAELRKKVKALKNKRILELIAKSDTNPFWQLELLDSFRSYYPHLLEKKYNLYNEIINCIPQRYVETIRDIPEDVEEENENVVHELVIE